MVTDAISDLFFVTEESGVANLPREGKPAERIHMVGHVMIDNLIHQARRLAQEDVSGLSTFPLKREHGSYCFMTLHRPSNVDDRETFERIAAALNDIAAETAIFFPVHPRTKKMMGEFGIRLSDRIVQLPPLGFRESLLLWKDAVAVLTDSGGLQEETTALGVPCVTIRENTERPVTVGIGTNVLAGTGREAIVAAYRKSLARRGMARVPDLWDGRASERIWQVIVKG